MEIITTEFKQTMRFIELKQFATAQDGEFAHNLVRLSYYVHREYSQ